MHIAHIAPEMTPFVKVGGLGDVVGSLPLAQVGRGHQLTCVIPGYLPVLQKTGLATGSGRPVSVPFGGREYRGEILELEHQGVRVLILAQEELFLRPGIYGEGGTSYGDNGLRYLWFSAAALEALRETVPAPDAILVHDWPTALVPVLLRGLPRRDDPLEATATILVIHNLAHQGIFPLDLARSAGLPELYLQSDYLESLGALNMLKGGIRVATSLITVSPTYAREIVWPDYGEGLDRYLLERGDDLVGILNGLDTLAWDPATDPFLPVQFDADDLAGKFSCKAALQRELGLRENPALPLFGMVSRIDAQKGIDLVEMVAPWLVDREAQIVVLGTGQRRMLEPLIGLSNIWKQSVSIIDRFDDPLAHRIYAGSDFFLMPSRFEPCGLGQLVALRYGTLPIVRRTGGLADTVRDSEEFPDSANGFLFRHADAGGLQWACEQALNTYKLGPETMDRLRRRAMADDLSWANSAAEYDRVIERAIRRERNRVMP